MHRSLSTGSRQFSNRKSRSKAHKAGAERILLDELTEGLDALPAGRKVMFKLTLPEAPDFYMPLIKEQAGRRVVALSGGKHPGRRLQAPRRQSRHDRQLLARARRGP